MPKPEKIRDWQHKHYIPGFRHYASTLSDALWCVARYKELVDKYARVVNLRKEGTIYICDADIEMVDKRGIAVIDKQGRTMKKMCLKEYHSRRSFLEHQRRVHNLRVYH